MMHPFGSHGPTYYYAVNARGASHVAQNKPCQDSFAVRFVRDGEIVVAAVADGVGSAAASEAGSMCAAQAAVQHCAKFIADNGEHIGVNDVLQCMKEAFRQAMQAVERHCRRDPNHELRDFDTTLCLAVYGNSRLYWGQSGDSGLIAAFNDGTYELLTRQQRDAAGRVYPLRFGERFWEFGAATKAACSFMLATDGVLENVFAPPILAKNWHTPLDRSQAHKFLRAWPHDEEHAEELQRQADAFFLNRANSCDLVDDRTALVVHDSRAQPLSQPAEYYEPPDWKLVAERRNAKLRQGLASAAPQTAPAAHVAHRTLVVRSAPSFVRPRHARTYVDLRIIAGQYTPKTRNDVRAARMMDSHVPRCINRR